MVDRKMIDVKFNKPVSCVHYDLLQRVGLLVVLGGPRLGPLRRRLLHLAGHAARLPWVGRVDVHVDGVAVGHRLGVNLINRQEHSLARMHDHGKIQETADGKWSRPTESYGERVQLELGALGFGRRVSRSSGSACCRVRMWQAVECQEALDEHKQNPVLGH
jgi:hypothetical protein